MNYFKIKKSQAELITTVLLILISIAAVVLVSTFVINMVRTNLTGTDCFKTAGQLTLNLEYTYYNSSGTGTTYVAIARGEGDFNLTGIIISAGTGQTSKAYTIKENSSESNVKMYDDKDVVLPGPSETRTYKITGTGTVNTVKVVPIIYPSKTCNEGADEQTVRSL